MLEGKGAKETRERRRRCGKSTRALIYEFLGTEEEEEEEEEDGVEHRSRTGHTYAARTLAH